jgi:hypothetical protein
MVADTLSARDRALAVRRRVVRDARLRTAAVSASASVRAPAEPADPAARAVPAAQRTTGRAAGHVVTLLGRGDPSLVESLLVEGIADYIGEDGRPIRSYPRLDVLRYYVRSGRWNGDLDAAEELFDGDLTEKNVGYALGYLTLRCIADRYGTTKMFDFAGDALFYTASYYAKQDLGEAWVDVKRACANYIRAAVR